MYYDVILWKYSKKGFSINRKNKFPDNDLIINDDDSVNILIKKFLLYYNLKSIYVWCSVKTSDEYIIYDFIKNVFKTHNKIDYLYFKKCFENYFENEVSLNDDDAKYINKDDALNIIKSLNIKKYNINIPLQFKYTNGGYFELLNYNPVRKDVIEENFKKLTVNSQLYNTIEYILSNIQYTEKESESGSSSRNPSTKNVSTDIIFNIINEDDIINNELMKSFYFPLKQTKITKFDELKDIFQKINDIEQFINNYKFKNKFNEKTYINTFACDFSILFLKPIKKSSSTDMLYELFNELRTSDKIPFIKYKTFGNIFYKINKSKLQMKEIINWTKYTFTKTSVKYVNLKIKHNNDVETIENGKNDTYYSVTIYNDMTLSIKSSTSVDKHNTIQSIEKFITELIDILKIKIISKINVTEIDTYNDIEFQDKNINFDNIDKIIQSDFFPYFSIISSDKNIIKLQYKKIDNYSKQSNIALFLNSNFTLSKNELILMLIDKFLLSTQEAENEYNMWSSKTKLEINADKNKKFNVKLRNDNNINIIIKTNLNNVKFLIKGLKSYKIQERILKLIKIILDYNKVSVKTNINKINKEYDDVLNSSDSDVNDKSVISIKDLEDLNLYEDDEDIDLDMLKDIDEFDLDKDDNDNVPLENTKKDNSPKKEVKKIFKQGNVLDMLKDADINLFTFLKEKGKSRADYATICQSSSKRMPVVINKKQKENIDKNYPGSYKNYVKTGSTNNLANKNFYICPAVWCPKSKVSLNKEQYEKGCPLEDEIPMLFDKSYWGHDNFLDQSRYVGYLAENIHPKKLCLPCCFKSNQEQKIKKSSCSTNFGNNNDNKEEKSTIPVKDTAKKEVIRYVKNQYNYPLKPYNKGKLPDDLNLYFSSDYVRFGILHGNQSFLSAISFLFFENKDPDTIYNLLKNIPLDIYITADNGKLLRTFIDTNIRYNKETSKNFMKWINTQENYLKKFNVFTKKIISNFIIYNSYTNFISLMNNDNIIKNHILLLDLINNEHDFINKKKIQVIILEMNVETNRINLLCPPNKLNKNLNFKYSLILKSSHYYEPIIVDNKGEIQKYFSYDEIKDIIDLYYNNCFKNIIDNNSVEKELKIMGYVIKDYVINFDYKVRGYILENDLYIPIENIENIKNIKESTFFYYDKLINLKCKLKDSEIVNIFKKLESKFGKFYKIIYKHIIDNKLKAYVLHNKITVIPIDINENDGFYFSNFKKDVEIFMNKQLPDKRVKFMEEIKDNEEQFSSLLKLIELKFENNDSLKNELNFLLDPFNPFPKKFKRYKINEMIKDINIDIKFISRIVESILLNNKSINYDTFNQYNDEVILNHYEISNGMLQEFIEFQKNPYKIISFKMEELSDEFIFNDYNSINFNKITNHFRDNKELVVLPIKYSKLLPRFSIIENKENYNNVFIYNLFTKLTNRSIDELKLFIKDKLKKDYDNNELIEEFYSNPSFKYIYNNLDNINLVKCMELIDNTNYFPSIYEIKSMSVLVDINFIIIGRKTKNNPDSITILNNNAENIIILNHSHDRFGRLDIYELLIKNNSILFTKKDIPLTFKSFVNNKETLFKSVMKE